eukprot:ANDGO_03197.mRNA.1 Charged multivesicular body protein 1
MEEQLFRLKFATKQFERSAKKAEKAAKDERLKVKKAMEKGNMEGARIYAQNAIRKQNEYINHLRLAARLDAVSSRLDTACKMNQVTKTMGGIVGSLDKALNQMDVMQITNVMDKFETQFEDLDVRSSYVENAMSSSTALSTPETDVEALMAEVADEHGLQISEQMSSLLGLFVLVFFQVAMRGAIFVSAALIIALVALCEAYPLYKQCDSRWGSHRLGTSTTNTICSAGCAMSSVAMALSGKGHTTDPGQLNDWLVAHSGYASGDLIVWGAVSGLGLTFHQRYSGQGSLSVSELQSLLAKGFPVVINVRGGSHWVLATSVSRSTVNVNDPGFSVSSYQYSDIVNFIVYNP